METTAEDIEEPQGISGNAAAEAAEAIYFRFLFAFKDSRSGLWFCQGVESSALRRQTYLRSWADRHQFAIGMVLTLVGFAAVGAIRLLGAKGSLAVSLGAFGAFAVLFGEGFRRNRGPIFPPSEITQENRWKYLILAAVLWIGVFATWWYLVRPLPMK